MASFNLTVMDSSPLITYSPAGSWIDTPPNDTLASSYSGGSFHTTTTQGATATIHFNGTGISIFGGNRPNYGTFSLAVDGQLVVTGTARSTVLSTRQLLGTVSGLINGPHTAVFANTNGQPVDLDSIELQSQVGALGSAVTPTMFDDSDAAITYLPSPSVWQRKTAPCFFNGTLHSSQTPGASASLSFSGEAVVLYGSVSPNHANIHIVIDGHSLILPGGSGGKVSAIRSRVLLNNLLPGQHTLVLSGNSTPLTGFSIDLDSITAFSATGVSSTTIPTPVSIGDNPQPKSNTFLSTGPIIGAVGGIVGFLLFFTLIALGLLYQRRRRKNELAEASLVPNSPEWPMQIDPKMLEARSSQNSAKLENTVFRFPPTVARVLQRPATPSWASLTSKFHSRDSSVMSSTSITPSIRRPIPKLNVLQPSISRTPVFTSMGLGNLVEKNIQFKPVVKYLDANTPPRPTTRPPTIDFGNLGDLDPE